MATGLVEDRLGEARVIKDTKLLEAFEENELRKEKPDYESALCIFEAMWREGMLLGVLPLKDPQEPGCRPGLRETVAQRD